MIWWPADDCIDCAECHGRCHDAIRTRGKATLLECNYCGLKQWAYNAPPEPVDDRPRMSSGRFAGMTFDEIENQRHGRKYLEHLVKTKGEHSEAAERHLAASQ